MANIGSYLFTELENATVVSPYNSSDNSINTDNELSRESDEKNHSNDYNDTSTSSDNDIGPQMDRAEHQPTTEMTNGMEQSSSADIPSSLQSQNMTKISSIPQGSTRCGCPLCDEVSLHQKKKGMMCTSRIDFLIHKYKLTEEEACFEASDPSNPIAPCRQECNPKVCSGMTQKPRLFKPDLSNVTESHEPFTRHDGVVIVSKIWAINEHSETDIKRMICLMNAAYNRHLNYDYVIFVGMPFSQSQEIEMKDHAYPAKLTLVLEPSLEEHLANMTKDEIEFLKKRCNVLDGENITWFHYCTEEKSIHLNNLAYSWQAEFRAAHIYTQPEMMKYKYMIWLDTDSWIMKDWDKDPIQAMVDHDLVILFDAFGYGRTRGKELKQKMEYAYNSSICSVNLNSENGHLQVEACGADEEPYIDQIGGFNHITNLDIYRKKVHQKFLLNMVGDYKFSRKWDDQLGVTVPALFESAERCWDARANGFDFGILHHYRIDAKDYMFVDDKRTTNEDLYWGFNVSKTWEAGRLMCDHLIYEK